MPDTLTRKLEEVCEGAAEKISKIAPGEKNEKKLEDILSKEVCKGVDKKLLTLIAEELAKQAQKESAKAPPNTPPKVTGVTTPKEPGSGVPSLKIPFPEIDLGGKMKGQFELKLWGDPKEFEKSDKGVMVYFTVKRF